MNNTNHPNLSNKSGSIANTLLENKKVIESMFDGPHSADQMKRYLTDLVRNITDKQHKSQATMRFLTNLQKQYNKMGILSLVWNTIQAGDNLKVIR